MVPPRPWKKRMRTPCSRPESARAACAFADAIGWRRCRSPCCCRCSRPSPAAPGARFRPCVRDHARLRRVIGCSRKLCRISGAASRSSIVSKSGTTGSAQTSPSGRVHGGRLARKDIDDEQIGDAPVMLTDEGADPIASPFLGVIRQYAIAAKHPRCFRAQLRIESGKGGGANRVHDRDIQAVAFPTNWKNRSRPSLRR